MEWKDVAVLSLLLLLMIAAACVEYCDADVCADCGDLVCSLV